MMAKIAFLTCHQKDAAVQHALKQCGFEVEVFDAFNTDNLGTFTNEKPRELTQMQTALKKAQLACELTNRDFGLGSEGSFGPHPQVHLLPWNYEVLAFWDAKQQHAIYAVHGTAETNFAGQRLMSIDDALSFAKQAQFPSHALIVGSPSDAYFQKGIQNEAEFQCLLNDAFQKDASVWVETDMRAHMNPTRMKAIEASAHKLASLLNSNCPGCNLPGFGLTQYVSGALCSVCGSATRLPKAERWSCAKCQFTEDKELNKTVSAASCDKCNP
jgi:hypothetical protein